MHHIMFSREMVFLEKKPKEGADMVNGVTQTNVMQQYDTQAAKKAKKEEKTAEETKTTQAAEKDGATYEKGSTEKSATYSINKMSQSDRDAIISQMKADAEQRKSQLLDLVQKTLYGQAGAYGKATGDDVWKLFADGKVTVDDAAREQAQKDIAEDGYWGVKQTSQRLFDFASALAGDDVEQMKKMQAAMEKGYKEATKAWGKELPSICKDTLDAANKLFEDYYSSKEVS